MTAVTKLHEGDLIRLIDRNHGDQPGGVVISCHGPLVWFLMPDGGGHVARRRVVRRIRQQPAVQQEGQSRE